MAARTWPVRHPFLLQAGKTSTVAIAFGNDIIGLKADLLRGIRDNLVLSRQEEYGGDLQQNVERAAVHFHRAAAELSALRARFHPRRGAARSRPRPTTRRRRLPSPNGLQLLPQSANAIST